MVLGGRTTSLLEFNVGLAISQSRVGRAGFDGCCQPDLTFVYLFFIGY